MDPQTPSTSGSLQALITSDRRRRMSLGDLPNNLRMVVLGSSGVGKSATANTILGKEGFKETETIACGIQSGTVDGRNISVVDTPGFNNTSLTTEQWRTEMKRCVLLSSPGPHVFLLVIKVKKITEEERNAVKWIQKNFGEEALKFTMILFIGREEMTNRQCMLFSQDARTLDFVTHCGGGYCTINSKREVNPAQITKLLEEIETMVQQNGGQYYTQEVYKAVEKKRIMEVTHEKLKTKKGHERKREEQVEERQKQERKARERAEEKKRQDREKTSKEEVFKLSIKEIHTTHISVTSTGGDKTTNQDKGLQMRREDIVIRTEDKKEGNYIAQKKQEESMEAKFKKENFRRQEEIRRERERKKWEEERGATGGVLPDPVCDVRIVLLGGVGAGKSSSGNTILGREAFGNDILKVTTMCKRQDGMVGNKSITVINTKGYARWYSRYSFSLYCEQLEQCLSLCTPGPHVFLLVVPSPKIFSFPVHLLFERFGSEVLKRTLVLITHGDSWGRDHKTVLNKSSELQQLVHSCGEVYHIFNNEQKEDQTQVTELLEKIEILIKKNGGGCCTTEMFRRKLQQAGSCSLI